MGCPACNAARLVEISVALAGRIVTLHSCSRCETKWWDDNSGEPIELPEVLELATVRR